MCNPKILCRKHLLGEHVEHHMMEENIRNNKKIDGYIKNNLMDPSMVESRHNELGREMIVRGFTHKSGLQVKNKTESHPIDKEAALQELLKRCPECRQRYDWLKKANMI